MSNKTNIKKIEKITYDEMVEFILGNVEYTYNVEKCISDFINHMNEIGCEEDIFYMNKDKEHFKITIYSKILNQDTDNEEIIYTYDVEKIEYKLYDNRFCYRVAKEAKLGWSEELKDYCETYMQTTIQTEKEISEESKIDMAEKFKIALADQLNIDVEYLEYITPNEYDQYVVED